MKCINTKSPEYLVLQEMTGLMPYELNALIRDYYEKTGDFPTVDKCLDIDHDTSQHLIKTYGLKKLGKSYTTKDQSMVNQIEINNQYRDLEVSVKESAYGYPIIDIKQRAILNRDLPSENQLTVFPTFMEETEELIPIYSDDTRKIYEYNGRYYVSDQRISDSKLLDKLPNFDNLRTAQNAKIQFSRKGFTGNLIRNIKFNKDKLDSGYEITVNSRVDLPENISFYNDFNYPKFIINPNQKENFIVKDGVIILNPRMLNNLEYNLLMIMGYDKELAQNVVNNLSEREDYYTIKNKEGNFTIKKVEPTYTAEINNPANNITYTSQSIEPMLDRLEELYGIKFNRVTNEEIRNSNLNQYITDATQVNAFILDGQIYINMDNAKADAPIHELSHLLLGCLKQTNPELYSQIVNSVEQYPEYQYELSKYKNRARSDANEEIFVDLFARHYVNGLDLGVDQNIMTDAEYEMARSIDSAIFPNVSTTKQDFSSLMNKSLVEIMTLFGSVLNKDTLAKAFTSDISRMSRYMANMKEKLFETNALKEYCNG